MEKQCSNCIFYKNTDGKITCYNGSICEHYSPLYSEIEDDMVFDYIEEERTKFHEEFSQYIEKFYFE